MYVLKYSYMVKEKKDHKTPTKLNLKCGNEIWNRVLKYKIDNKCANLNDAVLDLIEKGLAH